jgi:CelD/BcsL family acetyltransferase involved in cellulose biosynthesis
VPDRFRLITVWNGDRLDAVMPMQGFRSWRHRHCLLCTPLVRAEGAPETLAALIESLRDAWVARLDYIPADGAFFRTLRRIHVRCLVLSSYERPVLRRAKDGEAYLHEFLSGKDRQELRRRERRLLEMGNLRRVVLGPKDDVGRWIDDFLRLEASGWKGKQGTALACSEANRRFAIEVFGAAHARGRLEMVGIDLDGRPIARSVGFLAGEGAFAFKPAYDEAFARFSPGIISEVARIRNFHDLPGVRWMDSFTDANSSFMSRLWKDRLTVQSVAFGTNAAGAAALAALPLLRWAKRTLSAASRARGRPAPAQPQPASAP